MQRNATENRGTVPSWLLPPYRARSVDDFTVDHVIFRGRTMICENCGDRQEITLPQRVPSALAVMKGFIEAHEGCEPMLERAVALSRADVLAGRQP